MGAVLWLLTVLVTQGAPARLQGTLCPRAGWANSENISFPVNVRLTGIPASDSQVIVKDQSIPDENLCLTFPEE